jgi:hypothetical protein
VQGVFYRGFTFAGAFGPFSFVQWFAPCFQASFRGAILDSPCSIVIPSFSVLHFLASPLERDETALQRVACHHVSWGFGHLGVRFRVSSCAFLVVYPIFMGAFPSGSLLPRCVLRKALHFRVGVGGNPLDSACHQRSQSRVSLCSTLPSPFISRSC